eukprot:13262904-Heterocapsa_arctica.AAC.1
MNAEETRDCQPYKKVKSICGQANWSICRHVDCYGCYFKNSVVDLMTDDIKEEAIVAIGVWRNCPFWRQAGIEQKIEHVAYYLATRPVQRSRFSKFGA